MSHDHGRNESKVLLKPKKIISRVKSHSQDHSEAVDFFKSVYHAVVESMGPDCPFDRIAEDPSTGVGSVPIRIDACAQTETAIDEILQSEAAVNGTGGAPAIRVDSSSEEDTKENVLVESLKMKAVLRTMKNEKLDEPESSLHFVVIENLPPTITASDLERDMFSLVDIDKKTLALNIVRANKAECSVQVYTNDQRQAQKILACNKKVVVGGRVITTRKGMV